MQDIITLVIIVLAILALAGIIYRKTTRKGCDGGCGCGCSSCSTKKGDGKNHDFSRHHIAR